MARVEASIEEVDIENEGGRMQDGVRATCSRCDHETEAFGTGPKSRRRCLVLLRDECPMHEENFYVDKDGDDDGGGRSEDPKPRPWWEKKR
jgi:hypothetical protein